MYIHWFHCSVLENSVVEYCGVIFVFIMFIKFMSHFCSGRPVTSGTVDHFKDLTQTGVQATVDPMCTVSRSYIESSGTGSLTWYTLREQVPFFKLSTQWVGIKLYRQGGMWNYVEILMYIWMYILYVWIRQRKCNPGMQTLYFIIIDVRHAKTASAVLQRVCSRKIYWFSLLSHRAD